MRYCFLCVLCFRYLTGVIAHFNYMEEQPRVFKSTAPDQLALKLQQISHWALLLVFGLLPLIFIPTFVIPNSFTKIVFVVFAVVVAAIFFSLSVLRSGKLSYSIPYALIALWGVALVSVVSALLSGDIRDSFFGDVMGTHTGAFTLLLAATATLWVLVGMKKEAIMRLYMLIIVSTFVLALYHVVRLFFGESVLSFGVFTSATLSPIGGWNDLALFFGLVVLLSLVTLEQLPLTKWGRVLFGMVVCASLIMLAVINFSFVWIVLGLVSAVMVVYVLGKDRFGSADSSLMQSGESQGKKQSIASLIFPLVVCVASGVFILGGSTLSGAVANMTDISYIEVRPSFEATADIAQNVYRESAFLGTGPNKFADAWRQHKDDSINSTIFWNTDFQSGSGYIPSFFVTTGVLGGLAWILFIGLFVYGGVRMILRSGNQDRVWYFIGLSSFVGASFIWVMSFVYVPGPAILLLGALCTGVAFVAQGALNPTSSYTVALATNRRSGFLLTLGVVVFIAGSVGVGYLVAKQYAAVYLFAEGSYLVQQGGDLEEAEQKIAQAFALSGNDLFARRIAEYQLARMNALLNVESPTEQQRTEFQNAAANGINAGTLAIERDATDPENWSVLGNVYAILAAAQAEGSYAMAKERLERARSLDPKNPRRLLNLAQLESRQGNVDEAYRLTESALALKANYSDGLYYLSQLDIARGNVEKAIESTRAIISLAPEDPARYYQLGVLEASRQNSDVAVLAFEEAIRLNPSYSNARYFLALTYADMDRPEDARQQLQRVLELNPGNELVMGLIAQLDETGTITFAAEGGEQSQPVEGDADAVDVSEDVTTDTAPNTPLVKPVNTPPAGEEDTNADGE